VESSSSADGDSGPTWHRLAPDEQIVAFRFVHVADPTDPDLIEDFRSNAELRKPRKEGERRDPANYHGISVFKSHAQAIDRRKRIVDRLALAGQVPRIGDHIAKLALHGPDVIVDDPGNPDGHMTLWGVADLLASLVTGVTPCEPPAPA
jgi:hypothetical protein